MSCEQFVEHGDMEKNAVCFQMAAVQRLPQIQRESSCFWMVRVLGNVVLRASQAYQSRTASTVQYLQSHDVWNCIEGAL